MSLLGTLFSAFVPTVHCDDQQSSTAQGNPESQSPGGGEADTKDKEDKEDVPKGAGAAEDGGEEKEEGGEEGGDEAEEEEEEAEDLMPKIREECADSKHCAPYKKEFEHCEKKVHEGQGRHHEDCVEELFHMMHCVDACSAPKLFSKLV